MCKTWDSIAALCFCELWSLPYMIISILLDCYIPWQIKDLFFLCNNFQIQNQWDGDVLIKVSCSV